MWMILTNNITDCFRTLWKFYRVILLEYIAYKIRRCTGFKPSRTSGKCTLLNNIFTISSKAITLKHLQVINLELFHSLDFLLIKLIISSTCTSELSKILWSSCIPNSTCFSIHSRLGCTLSPH